jgi:hypothetical protein
VARSQGAEPGPAADAGFAERLLELIDSGRRTATYKLALLMALLDLSARRGDADGRPPSVLHTREIAERVAAIYWPQVMAYRRGPQVIQLRQITWQRSAITEAVLEFRRVAEAKGVASLGLARQRLTREYSQMLDRVEVAVLVPRSLSWPTATAPTGGSAAAAHAQAARRRIDGESLLHSSASADRIVSPTRRVSLGGTTRASANS